jgi:hypothetical protein
MANSFNKIPFQPETNCVFHFTSEFKTLFKILSERSFNYSYSREFILANTEREIGVPCVCFSSRPLSKIRYMASYGKWGIGLSKDWARRQQLNPVFYLEPKSKTVEIFNESFDKITKEISKYETLDKSEHLPDPIIAYMLNVSSLLFNCKISIGPNKKVNKTNYPFLEEREWRSYLDLRDFDGKWEKIITEVGNDWETKKLELNESISKFKLEFQLEDIEFIIANDVEKLISKINISNSFTKENGSKIDILKTKIISYKNLVNQVV